MKKLSVLFAAIALLMLFTACSTTRYNDGVYVARSAEFAASGWKDIVTLTVENGKISKTNWDAAYKDDSVPIMKKQYSKSGLYGMLVTGAVGEWYDQATSAEQFVLENGIDALNVKEDGYTDAVSGCTIHVSEFDKLLRQCLQQAEK